MAATGDLTLAAHFVTGDVPSKTEGRQMSNKLCYSVDEVCEMTGFGRRRVLDDIHIGRLKARRRGRRYFILAEDLTAYLEAHPVA